MGSGRTLDTAFEDFFGSKLPESLNQDHQTIIIAAEIDASTERIVRYLSNVHGANINVLTFQCFRREDGGELLARVYLIEPDEVEQNVAVKGKSKRRTQVLTDQRVAEIMEEKGLEQLYRSLESELRHRFAVNRTASTINFVTTWAVVGEQ